MIGPTQRTDKVKEKKTPLKGERPACFDLSSVLCFLPLFLSAACPPARANAVRHRA